MADEFFGSVVPALVSLLSDGAHATIPAAAVLGILASSWWRVATPTRRRRQPWLVARIASEPVLLATATVLGGPPGLAPELWSGLVVCLWCEWAYAAAGWLSFGQHRLAGRLSQAELLSLLSVAAASIDAGARAVVGGGGDAAAVSVFLCGGTAIAAIACAPAIALQPARGRAAEGAVIALPLVAAALFLAVEYVALYVAVLHCEPLTWLLMIVAENVGTFAWLATVLAATLAVAAWSCSCGPASDAGGGRLLLLTRKGFHVAAAGLFVPPVLLARSGGLSFLALAAVGALHLAVLLELVRATSPLRSRLRHALDAALRPFRDSRDAEPLVLSHIFLIAGCGLPLLLGVRCGGGSGVGGGSALLLLAGVLAAVGDAAAAGTGLWAAAHGVALPWARVVGACLPLRGAVATTLARKTVQGTVGFAVAALATSLAIVWAAPAGSSSRSGEQLFVAIAVSAFGAAAVETATEGVDNLLLPFVYWLLLRATLPRNLCSSSHTVLE